MLTTMSPFVCFLLTIANGYTYRQLTLRKVEASNKTSLITFTTVTHLAHSVIKCSRMCFDMKPQCSAVRYDPTSLMCSICNDTTSCVQQMNAGSSAQVYETTNTNIRCEDTKEFELWTNGSTKACLWFSSIMTTFFSAKNDCSARGSILATFKTLEKYSILQMKDYSSFITHRNVGFFIGLDDINTLWTFRWHDDNSVLPLDYQKMIFADGEPNNWHNIERCVIFDSYVRKLNDFPCDYANYYICEIIDFEL